MLVKPRNQIELQSHITKQTRAVQTQSLKTEEDDMYRHVRESACDCLAARPPINIVILTLTDHGFR